MSTKTAEVKLCINCMHYLALNQCRHPKAVSLVTGAPGDCIIERTENTVEFPDACGKEGNNYERRVGAAPKPGGKTPPASR